MGFSPRDRVWRNIMILRPTNLTLILLLSLTHLLLAQQSKPYLDPALPLDQRVSDLVGRMTLAEEVSQMQNDAPAIPRLGIPAYNWWNEVLHGVARSGIATVFPQAIGLSATWNTPLIHSVADAISTEARAKYNQAQREGNYSIYYGLTVWSPNINIVRDPRWGRGQETYGEDPFLTGSIGEAFVTGLQGNNPHYLKVVATAKHFAVHSGPESTRHTFNVDVSPYDLQDTYLPAFRRLIVDAHAASLMCAYNSIDGAPACANKMLLEQTLKQKWHFDGFIVSDCGAIGDVANGHHFAPDMPHAAALSVQAGTDLSCGKEYSALNAAVSQGLISKAEIDAAVKRLFTGRFRLGMFDPPAKVPYSTIPFSETDSPAHAQLALRTSRESIVLLKNEQHTLPLSTAPRTIAVVGPNAASLAALEGNYNAVASHPVTPLAALESRLPGHVLYAQGSSYVEGIPVPVPPTVFGKGLNAEYFSSPAMTGTPAFHRVDHAIDFDWNAASPGPGVPAKGFAVRWTGTIAAPAPGTLRFGFSMAHCSPCEDAETVHVWLDGKQVYEFVHPAAHGRRAPATPFSLTFPDTNPHPIRIEYTHEAPHFGAGLTFNWEPPADVLRAQAVAVANKADLTIAFLGLSPDIEGEEMPVYVNGFEGGDRSTIELPDVQLRLAEALAATGKPLVVVLMNGMALALGNTEEKASSILEAWYPGEAGGTAIAETLLGQNNPSGRLPVTFYASTNQLPAFDNYSMKGRTYRYFTGKPLYPFGYGLSYTTFQYQNGVLSSKQLKAGDPLQATVELKNSGERDGEETVEYYLIPKAGPNAPLRWLAGFQKVQLAKGQSKSVHLTIQPRQLSLVSADGTRAVRPGDYELYIGGSQPVSGSGVLLPFHIEGQSAIAP
jgi:beta-glucosidase